MDPRDPRPTPETGGPTRRQFLLATTALATGAALLGNSQRARASASTLQAYAAAASVLPGGTLDFHVRDPGAAAGSSTQVPACVLRLGDPDVLMISATIAVPNQAVPADAYANGCGWPATCQLPVGEDWPSGVYVARFGSDWWATEVPFVVRARAPGSASRVLVQVPFTTIQAYNAWGGKSLYDYNSSGGQRAPRVSFNRPLEHTVYAAADPWVTPFVRWLARNGIAAEFCTSLDLHADANLLAPYQLFITVGHDEYWSRTMRERLDRYVWDGGNAISLSGNTCWWQVRLEAGADGTPDRSLVCYKDLQADPVADPALKTVNWIDLSPAWPENTTLGLGFVQGAVWANGLPRPATPYIVMQPEHWLFEGTGLSQMAEFGHDIVGYETDAANLLWGEDGRLHPVGDDGTPRNLQVLAVADARSWADQAAALGAEAQSGLAVIGLYQQGGTVLSVGSTDWVHGLLPELDGATPTPVSRITLNAVQRLSQPDPGSGPLTVDVMRYHVMQAHGDGARFFFSTSAFVDAAWTLDGVVFKALAPQAAGAVPVYQYHVDQADGDGQRHRYSLQPALPGWTLDGVAFHAYADPQAGRIAIYQYHAVQASGDGSRYLLSISDAEGNGWTLDGPVFYTVP